MKRKQRPETTLEELLEECLLYTKEFDQFGAKVAEENRRKRAASARKIKASTEPTK